MSEKEIFNHVLPVVGALFSRAERIAAASEVLSHLAERKGAKMRDGAFAELRRASRRAREAARERFPKGSRIECLGLRGVVKRVVHDAATGEIVLIVRRDIETIRVPVRLIANAPAPKVDTKEQP